MFGCSDEWITRAYYTDLGLLVYRKSIKCTDLNLGFWVLWTNGMRILPGQVSRQRIWDSTIWYTCLVGGFNLFQIWSNNVKYVSIFNPLTWHFPEETSHYISKWTPIYVTRICQVFFFAKIHVREYASLIIGLHVRLHVRVYARIYVRLHIRLCVKVYVKVYVRIWF